MALDADSQRLFFAFWPDDSLRHAIIKACRRAVKRSGGKPVPAANFHITLAFLGSLDADGAGKARQAADRVRAAAFDLQLDRLGFWSGSGLLWLGATQPPQAARVLAADLVRELRTRGLAPDAKAFVPHLSLARKVLKPGLLGAVPPLNWHVDAFALMRSHTHGRNSEYQLLASWPLESMAAGSGEL